MTSARYWVALWVLLAAGCPAAPPASDGGPGDSGVPLADAGPVDAGTAYTGSCANEGDPCSAAVPCCLVTCGNGVQVVSATCDPSSGLCLPLLGGTDAGDPCAVGGGTGGGTDGGTVPIPDGGLLPTSDAGWVPEAVLGNLDELTGLSVPAPGIALACGSGQGEGALLARAAGTPPTWAPLPNGLSSGSLLGVLADGQGNLLAVGSSDAGTGLWLSGSADGGVVPIALPGAPATGSLLAVVGLGGGEAVAVGLDPTLTQPVALHLDSDGGVTGESLPAGIRRPFRLAASAGTAYALAVDGAGASHVLVRVDGGWGELPSPLDGGELNDLAIGPAGDLVVVGDDGCGDGLAFDWSDGGFASVPLPPGGLPPLTAVAEPTPGDIVAAAILNQDQCNALLTPACPNNAPCPVPPAIVERTDAGWATDAVPALTVAISAIAGGADAGLFAAGSLECQGCSTPTTPLILRRGP